MATRAKSRPPSSARPSGTVTFLFSDIEGSTARWEAAPEAMGLALARHDVLVRDAIEAHSGYVFKTMGDAFCAAFATAPDALAAALDAQSALAAEDFSAVECIRVRMALHSGRANERDGDYFGPTVNRVARLLAIGHGRQVLISDTCAKLLQGEIPSQSSLRDLGAHRLKDLAQPEHVFQLVVSGLPETFPALLSLDHLSNNLPAQLSSFVGRDEVVAEVKTLLEEHRVVTLVGTGGAGKTRCAIQVGAELVDGSGDGVWLAELAPISEPSLVANVVARALSVQESLNRPMLETLLAYLKRKRLLLILDNCEHVIEEARRVVAAIVHRCPEVRILATSREGLNIAGEEAYRMPSLAVPSESETQSSEELSSYGAVQLFTDRAISADKHFAFSDENAPYVAEICRRLDGIPLAIELAAARVKVLSPKQLAQKLDERFRVLTGGDRSALPRHQTMRALIDWSYDLLSDNERKMFRTLSIFAGSFTLESASAVCSEEAIDEIATLDLLSSLVDKSLVQTEQTGGGTRYRLLESTREYGRERLCDAGDYAAVAQAHASAFLALAEELNRDWDTSPDALWFAQAELELENFRAALNWALGSRGEAVLGGRLVAALRPLWMYLAAAEGRRWIQATRELVGAEAPAPVVAALDLTEASLDAALCQYKASCAAGERALARYRELADSLRVAHAQQIVGQALVILGRVEEANVLLSQALAASHALEKRRLTGLALQGLALAANALGDVAEARSLHADALEIFRVIGAKRTAAAVSVNLAETEFHSGDAAEALRLAGEALDAFRGFNHTLGVALALRNMAAYLTALERFDEARTYGREGLVTARDAQDEVGVAFVLQHLVAIAALRPTGDAKPKHDDQLRAARVLGYVNTRIETLELFREYTEQQEYDKVHSALSDALGANECAKLMAEGGIWNEDQAVAEAMLI